MGVRLTETRIPLNFQAGELGEAVTSPDGKVILVSFITSPLAITRENSYVFFVTDSSLASDINSFEWTFTQAGTSPSLQTTDVGETTFTPSVMGALEVKVKALDSGGTEKASLTMNQEVVAVNTALEALIAAASENPGPGIGNIDVAREQVNDYNPYYQNIAPQNATDLDGLKKFVFTLLTEGLLRFPPGQRKQNLSDLSSGIGTNGDMVSHTLTGHGVCKIRLQLLAMILPLDSTTKWLAWREIPEASSPRAAADRELRENLSALEEEKRIDLFNIVRFPKSNIVYCGKILEVLREKYFNGTSFSDILTGMSGTRAHWINRHYHEGPLAH